MTDTPVNNQTDEGATQPPSDDAGVAQGEPTLDELLNEMEVLPAEQPQEPRTETPSNPRLDSVVSFVDEFREKAIREQTQTDISKAVEAVKKDIGVSVPDRLIEGLLHREASTDPRFMRAFQMREKDPATWNKVLKASAKEFKNDFEQQTDPDTTEDVGAVRAAVRSATNSPPIAEGIDPGKLNSMSDAEFAAYKRQLGG